jgi:hypothetical protein
MPRGGLRRVTGMVRDGESAGRAVIQALEIDSLAPQRRLQAGVNGIAISMAQVKDGVDASREVARLVLRRPAAVEYRGCRDPLGVQGRQPERQGRTHAISQEPDAGIVHQTFRLQSVEPGLEVF